ncbi:MAG: trigger factor [Synechococcaceae cyanobacterium]
MSSATSPASTTTPIGQGDSSGKVASTGLGVTTSALPGSRLALGVSVPGGRCQSSYDAAVDKLSRSVRLPGFRPGKVPRQVLLNQIGTQRIRATALEDLVDSAYRDALAQTGVAPLSRPELEEEFETLLNRFEPGAPLEFTLRIDVRPTPRLKTTRGLSAEVEALAFDPDQVDALIEQSRRRLATLVPVEGRPAALGDVAQVAFEGRFTDSGEAIERGSSDSMELELEEGRMIPGFIEGMVGMAINETREVACTFPESYPQEDAAGRPASFAITLKELKTRELPPLDDAFAQQASDKSSLAELRTDLETRLREDLERRQRTNRHDALLKALIEQLEVELPESLIQEEMRAVVEQTASQLAQQGMDVRKLFTPDLVRSLLDTSRPEAEQRLQARLALEALAEAEAIAVEASAVEARVRELSREFSNEGNRIDPQRLRQAVEDDLLREALLTWLEENSSIRDKAPDSDDNTPTAAPTAQPAAAATTPDPTAKQPAVSGDASAAAPAATPSAAAPQEAKAAQVDAPSAAAEAAAEASKPARRTAKAVAGDAETSDTQA